MAKRPYKSTKLKLLQGARVDKRQLANEPKPRPVAPEPMPGLTASEKKAYRKLADQLTRVGLVTELDGQAISTIIRIQKEMVDIGFKLRVAKRLAKTAEKSGDLDAIATADKHLQRWLRQERQFVETFRRISAEVGLTPRGRTGLTVNVSPEDASLEDLLTKPLVR